MIYYDYRSQNFQLPIDYRLSSKAEKFPKKIIAIKVFHYQTCGLLAALRPRLWDPEYQVSKNHSSLTAYQ